MPSTRSIRNVFLLSSILFLPVLVLLFFSFFGENEFDVPVYYMERPNTIPPACDVTYRFPYTVSSSSRMMLQDITVIAFMDAKDTVHNATLSFHVYKVLADFDSSAVTWINAYAHPNGIPHNRNADRTMLFDLPSYRKEKLCYYLADGYDLVLIDAQRRIRGYYSGASLDEMDRLQIELNILLKRQ